MGSFALQLWDDESNYVTYYSVVKLDCDVPVMEVDLFFNRFNDNEYKEFAEDILYLLIETIGNKYGAVDAFFNRVENKAFALPPKKSDWLESLKLDYLHFPLRLFAYRINENIVILFNGGLKTAKTAQKSRFSIKFYEAQHFVTKIEEALKNGEIGISDDGKSLLYFNENDMM